MPNTLFVVDDSATMRKVFELTFAGEDVTVVTHDGGDGVLAKLREVRPQAAIVDVALANGSTGYDLVRNIRAESGTGAMPIYLLYSEHSPLDEGSARSCGAVGAIVKPFETQVLIDKVRQALAAGTRPSVTATTGNVTAPFGNPQASPSPISAMSPAPAKSTETVSFSAPRSGGLLGATPAVKVPTGPTASPAATTPAVKIPAPTTATTGGLGAAVGVRPPPPLPGATGRPLATTPQPHGVAPTTAPVERAAVKAPERAAPQVSIAEDEVQFEAPVETKLGHGAVGRPVEPQPEKPVSPVARPVEPTAEKPVAPAPAADALVQSVAREVEQRVAGLGLTPAQVEAVTALTRDVVERIVWEVVPQLAETMIREELKRLTAD